MRPRSAAIVIGVVAAVIGAGAACSSTYAEATPDAGAMDAGGSDGPPAIPDAAEDATGGPNAPGVKTLASGYKQLAGIFATDSTVYFVDLQEGGVHSVDIGGGNVKDIYMSGASPSGIVVSGTDIFWTDYGHQLLNHVVIGSGTNQSAPPGAKAPVAIALAGDRLVLVSRGASDVGDMQEYSFDLSAGPSIVGQQNPLDVAAYDGEVFWTESSAGNIGVARIGSDNGMVLASAETGCESIAADGAGVYWTRPGDGLVRASLSRAGATTLASAQSAPFSLAADESGVYWLTTDGRVRRSSRNELPIKTIASAFGGTPMNRQVQGLALTSKYVVWITADGKVLRADK